MRLAFAEHGIEVQCWKSKAELLQYTASCNLGSIVLGQDEEHHSGFYSVTLLIELGRPGIRQFALGICSETHGLIPYLLLEPQRHLILIGYNSEVTGFNTEERAIQFQHTFEAPFYTFIDLDQRGMILVIHEIGALAMTKSGQALWSYSKDIVTGWRVGDDTLHLEFMESPSVDLVLSAGSVAT